MTEQYNNMQYDRRCFFAGGLVLSNVLLAWTKTPSGVSPPSRRSSGACSDPATAPPGGGLGRGTDDCGAICSASLPERTDRGVRAPRARLRERLSALNLRPMRRLGHTYATGGRRRAFRERSFLSF